MAEYIERQAAIEACCFNCSEKNICGGTCDDTDRIRNIPTADVRPVRRGRWEMDSDGIPHCTECGYVAPQRLFLQVQSLACTTQFIMSNYCPDCGSYNGADMRGGDADGDTKD